MESLQDLSVTLHPSASVAANSKLPGPLICCFFSIKLFFIARVLYKLRINLLSSNSLHVTAHFTLFLRCLWMTCFLWISYGSILSGRRAHTLTLLMTFIFINQNQNPNQRTALPHTINAGTKLILLPFFFSSQADFQQNACQERWCSETSLSEDIHAKPDGREIIPLRLRKLKSNQSKCPSPISRRFTGLGKITRDIGAELLHRLECRVSQTGSKPSNLSMWIFNDFLIANICRGWACSSSQLMSAGACQGAALCHASFSSAGDSSQGR